MFFWEICEIFRTGFTRNTRKFWLLQLVVAGKRFDQNILFKKYLIRFDIQWHVLPWIKLYNRRLKIFHDVYFGLYLVCLVHFSSCFIHLDKWQCHQHCLDYTYSYFFETRSFKEAGSSW